MLEVANMDILCKYYSQIKYLARENARLFISCGSVFCPTKLFTNSNKHFIYIFQAFSLARHLLLFSYSSEEFASAVKLSIKN